MARVVVEVFPVEPDRWIAILPGPDGPFSTEAQHPDDVEAEVRRAATAVLAHHDLDIRLIDDRGRPWTPRQAPSQLDRLAVGYRPQRRTRLRRLLHTRMPAAGHCPSCGHDWREHLPSEATCGECEYEMSHGELDAPATACHRLPPPPPRPTPGSRSPR